MLLALQHDSVMPADLTEVSVALVGPALLTCHAPQHRDMRLSSWQYNFVSLEAKQHSLKWAHMQGTKAAMLLATACVARSNVAPSAWKVRLEDD